MVKKADGLVELETRAEILRVAKRCAPCLDTLGPITFAADPSSAADRRHWIQSTWLPLVSTAVRKAHDLHRRGHLDLKKVDADLDSRLVGPLAKTSRAAGRHLAARAHAPEGERLLAKYLDDVRHATTPGHFAVVFASRAGAFHIPLATCHAALFFLEMRNAPLPGLWEAVQDCLSQSTASGPRILAA